MKGIEVSVFTYDALAPKNRAGAIVGPAPLNTNAMAGGTTTSASAVTGATYTLGGLTEVDFAKYPLLREFTVGFQAASASNLSGVNLTGHLYFSDVKFAATDYALIATMCTHTHVASAALALPNAATIYAHFAITAAAGVQHKTIFRPVSRFMYVAFLNSNTTAAGLKLDCWLARVPAQAPIDNIT